MSRKELLRRPFLVLLQYMDGKPYTEIIITSQEKEPEYYYPYNMLIIPGSRARRSTAFGGFELSHIYFNLEAKLYACDSATFINGKYILRHKGSGQNYYDKFRDFAKKFVVDMSNAITENILKTLQ